MNLAKFRNFMLLTQVHALFPQLLWETLWSRVQITYNQGIIIVSKNYWKKVKYQVLSPSLFHFSPV